tara:strand:+ start:2620 stop:4212 length:1593 start_codon:yes stop_codon:yes gene_type:complete
MSKAKQTSVVKKDPWVPSQKEWTQLQERGQDLMTARYEQSQDAANATMASADRYNTPTRDFQNAMQGAARQGNAAGPRQGLIGAANAVSNARVDPTLTRAVNAAQGPRAASVGTAVGRTMGASVDGGLTQATGRALNAQTSQAFNSGIDRAQNQGFDSQFDAATQAAQGREYGQGFQNTIYEMTDQDRRSAAFGQLKQNVANDVMAGVNATFGSSGMSGSSLHQKNLAKGLTEGIAGVENQAFQQSQSNALQAAQMSQQDLGQQRALGLSAAGSRQDAQMAQAGLALQAGGMDEQAQAANRAMAMQAGTLRNDASMSLRDQQMQAAGLDATSQNAQRSLAMQAGGAMNDAQMAQRMQGLSAQSTLQGAYDNQFAQQQQIQAQRMQAGGMLQNQQQQQYANLMGKAGQQAGLGQNWQNTSQGNVMGLIGAGNAGAATTQTDTQKPGFWGTLGNVATVGSMFSDERLKKNKKQVGTLFDGTPVYTYEYLDGVVPAMDGVTQMGVMAQEVGHIEGAQQFDPAEGFYRVNYGSL